MTDKREVIREGIPDSELFGKIVAMLHIAMVDQMGLVENPKTGKKREPNLKLAGETLAMLEFLRKRLKMSPEEVTVLDNVLDDLRIRYSALIDKVIYAKND